MTTLNRVGGIERIVTSLANMWSLHYKVKILVWDDRKTFYTLNDSVEIASINKRIISTNNRFLKPICAICKLFSINKSLRRYLCNNEFDYIYTVHPQNVLELYFAKKEFLNKVIASEHAGLLSYNKAYRWIIKVFYPKLSAISVPTSTDFKEYLRLACNVYYIPHLIEDLPGADSYFNIIEREKLIINVGRLVDQKRQDLLLSIWEKVQSEEVAKDWKLIIIGKGSNLQILKDIIRNQNIPNVSIEAATTEIQTYYNRARLFALTSEIEAFGLVLLEALSFGVPCIAFDCYCGPKDIINQNNGFLVNCFDIEDYAKKIIEFMKYDDEKLLKLQESSKQSTILCDKNDISRKWDELFESMYNANN